MLALMMDTVAAALKRHAAALGKRLPRDVSHTILFYTVGEAVRAPCLDTFHTQSSSEFGSGAGRSNTSW
jgi:hypothetical protein